MSILLTWNAPFHASFSPASIIQRSRMAAAYLKAIVGDRFETESAGSEPGKLNPCVVRAMAEDGIDISGNKAQSIFDLASAVKRFDCVIMVCSKEAAEACPIFPGGPEKLHWPFPDPTAFKGTDDEVMARVREVRDRIEDAANIFARER